MCGAMEETLGYNQTTMLRDNSIWPDLQGISTAGAPYNIQHSEASRWATAFSLLVLTERPHPTRLFLKNRGPQQASLLGWKKSRTSLPCPVQSRSENALRTMKPFAPLVGPIITSSHLRGE